LNNVYREHCAHGPWLLPPRDLQIDQVVLSASSDSVSRRIFEADGILGHTKLHGLPVRPVPSSRSLKRGWCSAGRSGSASWCRALHHRLMAIDEFVSGRFPCLLFSVNFDLTTTMTMTITSEFRVYGIYSRQSSTCGIFWPLFLMIARLIGATQASLSVHQCSSGQFFLSHR
jgi:hypothetical protein